MEYLRIQRFPALDEHCSQDALKEENMEYFKKLFVVAGVMAREGYSERMEKL